MNFSADRELSKRLERAEGHACARFAEAGQRVRPDRGTQWIECAGAYAVFNGIDSPVTQTFGLGLFEELNPASLGAIEQFFSERGAPVMHEVSPFAGADALTLLCRRGYKPVETSNVMYRPVEPLLAPERTDIRTRIAGPEEGSLWADVMAGGWLQEHPELRDFFEANGAISAGCEDSVRFLAELNGRPGAAGTLCIHQGVGLFGGAATIPEMRRRGMQNALIETRIRHAFDRGCDLLMIVAEPGSDSQRNAERNGFRVAYTRMKWQLTA